MISSVSSTNHHTLATNHSQVELYFENVLSLWQSKVVLPCVAFESTIFASDALLKDNLLPLLLEVQSIFNKVSRLRIRTETDNLECAFVQRFSLSSAFTYVIPKGKVLNGILF